jgi:phospholipid/cholesterol/gamma-HCH transport system ATP-binding protein
MTKRAALARAIIMDPKLLFFDEPSSGLDPITAAELDELILLLKKSMNMTILVVTHELESAFKIADQIAIMSNGEFLVVGGPDDIRTCQNPIVQSLLHRTPRETQVDTDAHLRALVDGDTSGVQSGPLPE